MTDATGSSSTVREFGDYELLRPIGQGAAGTVWEARQPALDRIVAVKVLHGFDRTAPARRERFMREAATLARVAHPGIVPLLDHGEVDGVPYVALERVFGGDLASALGALRVAAGSRFHRMADRSAALDRWVAERAGVEPEGGFHGSWADCVARILRDVAEALDHAHGCGVLHRDLKPSNVLLAPRGTALLADFGVAGVEGEEREDDPAGSLPYLSPERARGEPATRASEVYALGVMLFEAFHLERPFRSTEPAALLNEIVQGDLPMPTRTSTFASRGAAGRTLDAIARKAMARDPLRRYGSARDLARDLEALIAGRPVTARAVGPVQRLARWGRRHRVAAAFVLAATVVAVVLPTAIQWRELVAAKRVRVAARVASEQLTLSIRAIDRMLVSTARVDLVGVPRVQGRRSHLLEEALQLYDELEEIEGPQEVDRSLGLARVRALLGLAIIERDRGDGRRSLARTQAALDELSDTGGSLGDTALALVRARILLVRSDVFSRSGHLADSLEACEEALAHLEGVTDEELVRAGEPRLRTNLEQSAADALRLLGRLDDALDQSSRAIETARATLRHLPPHRDGALVGDLGNALNTRGAMYVELQRWEDVTDACLDALRVLERAPVRQQTERARALAHNNLGLAAAKGGRITEAIEHQSAARELQRRVLLVDTDSIISRYQLLRTEEFLADAMTHTQDRAEEGEALYADVLRSVVELRDQVPSSAEYQELLVRILRRQSRVVMSSDAMETQGAVVRRAYAEAERLIRMSPDRWQFRDHRCQITVWHCHLFVFVERDYASALPLLRRTIEDPAVTPGLLVHSATMFIHAGVQASIDGTLDEGERSRLHDELLDEAVATLELAVDAGFGNAAFLREQYVFTPIRDRADFAELVERIESH